MNDAFLSQAVLLHLRQAVLMSGYQEKLFQDDREARSQILRMLQETNGNEAEAARRLGISYRSLTRYVKKLNLQEALRGIRR